MSEPLSGDDSRQAVAPMRGYHYQILRSIYEWLDLAPGERLYLEGAEDFDRVSPGEAQSTQVKYGETDARLTLRTSAAVEAINNYWLLRNRNRGRTVRLIFLTTADVGVEAGAPFGVGRPGVRVWDEASTTTEDAPTLQAAEEVRRFLVADARVNSELLQCLSSASPSEIKAELVDRVTWSTSQPLIGDVEEAIVRKLTAVCWQRKVPAAYARKILDGLLRRAWATAIRASDRVLTIEDFYQLFDEVTTVPMSRAAADALEKFAAIQTPSMSADGAAQQFSIIAGSVRIGPPPPVFGRQLRRPTLDSRVLGMLREHGVAYLHGATGTGKTTQAAATAQSNSDVFLWVNCRDAEVAELRSVLVEAGRQIDTEARIRYVVLDDIDVVAQERALEETTPGLLYTLRRRTGGLLFTTQRPLSQRLQLRLGAGPQNELLMPPFSDADVRDLLRDAGLQDAARLDAWSALIIAKTSGHPQLVAARIAALAQSSFAGPTANDLLETPREIADAREGARLVISTQLPIEQKELLYRLSLITTPFERSRALALAQTAPELQNAGDSFDHLVGPWIERPSSTSYRLSPLLSSAGHDAKGAAWARITHAAIADTWLRFKEQSPWDVATILLSASIGHNTRAIVRLAVGLSKVSEEVWHALGQANGLFIHFYAGAGQAFPSQYPFEAFYARWLQLQLAARADPDACEAILDRVDDELSTESDDVQVRIMRHMLLLQVLALPGVALSPARLIRMMVEIAEGRGSFSAEFRREAKEAGISEDRLDGSVGFDLAPVYGVALIQRIKTCEQLQELLPLLDAMHPTTRAQCLTLFRDEPDMGRQLADSLWLSEHESPAPRWQFLSQTLDALADYAVRWHAVDLAQAVASVNARTLHEQLNDDSAALAVLRKAPSTGRVTYLLLDIEARILLSQGDSKKAIEVWCSTLEQWQADEQANVVGLAIAARNAAIAAARAGDWLQAARFFERGAEAASTAADGRFQVGLLADAAHARFRANDRHAAVHFATAALRGLQSIPNHPEDVRSYYLHKVIGHLMTWMAEVASLTHGALDEPSPGACSNLDPGERIRTFGQTPLALSQGNLLVIAQASRMRLAEFPDIVAALSQSPVLLARHRLIDAQLNEQLDDADAAQLPQQIARLLETVNALRREAMTERGDVFRLSESDPEFWMLYLCKGLLALVGRQRPMTEVLVEWRADVERLQGPVAVVQWIDEVAEIAGRSPIEQLRVLRSPDQLWAKLVATAALILATEAVDPRMLIHAHATLLRLDGGVVYAQMQGRAAAAASAAWRLAIQRPFSLIAPRVNVPRIVEACEAPGEPTQRLAKIFIAAAPAVDVQVPNELMHRARVAAGDM